MTSRPITRGIDWTAALGWTAIAQGALIGGGVAAAVLGARLLPDRTFGEVGFAVTAAGFVSMVAAVGLGPAVVAHASRDDAAPDAGIIRRQVAVAVIGLALVGVVWMTLVGPLTRPDGSGVELLAATLGLAAAGLATTAADAGARAGRDFALAALVGPAVRRVVLMLAIILGAGGSFDGPTIIGITAVAELAVGVVGLVRLLGGRRDQRGPSDGIVGSARRGAVFVPSTVVSVFVPQGVIWLVAAQTGDGELARLFVAVQVGLLFSLPQVIGGRVLAPLVAASPRHRLPTLERPARRLATLGAAAGLLGLAVLALLGPIVLPLVFGDAGRSITGLALVVGAGQVLVGATGLAGQVLPNAGLQHRHGVANLTTAAVFAVAVPVAMSAWGLMGAAVVAAVVPVVLHLWMTVESDRRLGLRTWIGRGPRPETDGPARIAFFDDRFDEVYGAQENVLLLAQEVAAAGHPVLVAVTAEGRLAESARRRGLPVVVVPAPEPLRTFEGGALGRGLTGRLSAAVAIGRYNHRFATAMRHFDVDLVFASAVRPSLSLVWTRRVARIPVVLFAQNSIPLGRFAALAAATADRIGLIGEGARSTFPEAVQRRHTEKFRALPSGRGFDDYPVGPVRLTDRSAPLEVVTVCSVTERKGVHHLVDAAAVLRAEGLDVRVRVVGGTNGPASEAYRDRLIESALRASVPLRLTGFTDDVVRHLHEADLVVLASADEGLPGVLLEAMAAGRACVTTRAGSAGELIEGCGAGIAVDVGDVDGLTAAMRSLLVDPSRRLDHARQGSIQVRTHYGLPAYRERFLTIVGELLGDGALVPTASPVEARA